MVARQFPGFRAVADSARYSGISQRRLLPSRAAAVAGCHANPVTVFNAGGMGQLAVLSLENGAMTLLARTEEVRTAAWSSDSRSIVFFARQVAQDLFRRRESSDACGCIDNLRRSLLGL
jgi:hypothetical protein